MKKMRMLAGVVLFGSIWGLMECALGDYLHNVGFSSGAIMTGFIGLGLMAVSRRIYGIRGMQLGMGAVAGMLKFLHPVGGCLLCSAIAIAVEGALFEMIWYSPRISINRINGIEMKVSMGIISGYVIYTLGYVATQVLTPLVVSAPFYLSDLLAVIPKILSSGTIAGLAGGLTLTMVLSIPNDVASRMVEIKKEVYYPVASLVSILCWAGIIMLP
ncbi:MAG: hypothetical protein U9O96_06970 [Candidatus Thermoplasmatota archaeon]|nr:hypothetical protein [Candidatus Thermoplasmatota archaeon]